jgi:hypothetical protein
MDKQTRQDTIRSCLQVSAGLLTIPAMLLLIAAIYLTHLRLTWLNPDFLKRVPTRNKIYDQLPEMILDGILEEAAFSSGESGLIEEFENTLGRESLEALMEAVIPPEWIREQVELNIDAFFAFLNRDTPYPYFLVQTSVLQDHATSEEVRNALIDLFANLPPCEWDEDFFRGDIPRCRPPDAILDELVNEAAFSLRGIFPVDFSFDEIIATEDNQEQMLSDFEKVQWGYRFFNWMIWGVWLAYLLLMGIIVLIFSSSLEKALLWAGWPTLAGSGIALIGFAAFMILVPLLAKNWLTQLPPDSPVRLARNFVSILTACNLDFQGAGLLVSGIPAILSALAVAGSVLLRRFQGAPYEGIPEDWM